MKQIKLTLTAVFLFAAQLIFAQGSTTASIGGKITDNNGEPLPGANITAVHQPSGSTYGATSDFDGFYRISNMRTGGPYTITITYVGFEAAVATDVFLQLGENRRISKQMQESVNQLDEIELVAERNGLFSSGRNGAETVISQRDIQNIPAASRSIADFVRLTPQASIREGVDGFSISISGQNNRYNAIYIDGAVNNDVFGLAGSGTNGGQTGVNPFSVDAIETFQVQVAPFDVKNSGFAGGSINAVTRSGTNNWEGSAYYFYRDENLAGKTPGGLVNDGDSRERLSEFSAETTGFRIGGPIIKDKLFVFINYENQDDETAQPFTFSNYQGDSSLADLQGLSNFLNTQFGYDPGSFENSTATLKSDKIIAKIDWNINQDHKLSLRHSYVQAENLEARRSSNRSIQFLNGSEFFDTETNSSALELNSRFGDKFANNFVFGYTKVDDDRDPQGSPFPSVTIQDGGGSIIFGAEPFSTANLLEQEIFTITNNFEIYSGAHAITIGGSFEYTEMKNVFFGNNFGTYTFSNLNDFLTNQPANAYQIGYSLLGQRSVGDDSTGAAEFATSQLAAYIQDDWNITDNFKLSLGLRIDVPFWRDGIENEVFNTETVRLLTAAGKDLQGARVGKGIDTNLHIAPRVGFNWDVFGNRTTQIRGGFGVFTSRLPLVWPGGTYNNNGVTAGFSTERDFADPIFFNPDVNTQQVSVEPGSGGTGGNIDLFAPDFQLPQVFKTNIAVDQKLPIWDLVLSTDFVYNENLQAVFYENLNIGGPVGFTNGPGRRQIFSRNAIDRRFGGIYLASNTDEGYSYNVAVTLSKPFYRGFQGSVSWTFGRAEAIFDGTSSQNSSQWRNQQTVNGKNSNLPTTISDFSPGHRVIANVSYEHQWTKNLKTTIGLFYEGSEGTPFSYIYQEGRDLLNDDSRDNALIYVPRNASEITLLEGANGLTAAEQWAALDAFIRGDSYLNSRRGKFAERNGTQGPWSDIVDLKFMQDFSINAFGKNHTLQFSADIFNFTNMLNEDWGRKKFVPGNIGLIRTETAGENPVFSFNPNSFAEGVEQLDDSGIQSSRWQMQLGIRYIFK
jgi:outer membrane receptor protein involved in Fe transport